MTNTARILLVGVAFGLLIIVRTPSPRATSTPPVVDAQAIAILKNDELERIKEMHQMAQLDIPPNAAPPYLDSLVLDQMLAQGMTPFGADQQRMVHVSTGDELRDALKNAQPGDFIYIADGVYNGHFEAAVSGLPDTPIILHGSRRAVIDGGSLNTGYGFHLAGDFWILSGFTIRNANKGVMTDAANHDLLQGLEIYQIGHEGIHFRRSSSDNLVKYTWVHDVGLTNAKFGEAIYIGSAVSNWNDYSGGQPDTSDRNQVIGNLLGPNVQAEGVDIKEGTTGGIVRNNSFLYTGASEANSAMDIKGNSSQVVNNHILFNRASSVRRGVDVIELVPGWGQNNTVQDNLEYRIEGTERSPFRLAYGTEASPNIVLPERIMPFTLSELLARFPEAFEQINPTTMLLKENIVAAQSAYLTITLDDVPAIRLLSTPERFIGIVGYHASIFIEGSSSQQLQFQSWDPALNAADSEIQDGRSYILANRSRMDVDYASFTDLGFEEGSVSGVAWNGYADDKVYDVSRGNVLNSYFARNYFGAYTYQAIEMRWKGNTFADNITYGFDPHDFSNDFVVEDNITYGNGKHGIIFSRGCERNIIRRNQSFNNHGNGIMIDDGKVLVPSPAPRWEKPVPSNYNIIEDNRIWSNRDGIVIEGGRGNIIRHNEILGPQRYGLQLKDRALNTVVSNNHITGSAQFGVFIYAESNGNLIENNTIAGGIGGVTIRDSIENEVEGNTITGIAGVGIMLSQKVIDSRINNNVLAGRGLHPISVTRADGIDLNGVLKVNDLSEWRSPVPLVHNAFLLIMTTIFFIPIVMTVLEHLSTDEKVSRDVRR